MIGKMLNSLVLVLLIAATTAAAGTLGRGVRDGSIKQPDGRSERVIFEVIDDSGQVGIRMTEEGGGAVTFDDVHFDNENLVFTWTTGEASIRCVLAPTDEDAYAGSCNDLQLAIGAPNP